MSNESTPSNGLLAPISDETAKAIAESAKLGGKLVDASEKLGGYVAGIVGRAPHDFVGLALGDWLAQVRIRRLAALQEETRAILQRRKIAPEEVSPSIAIPLLTAAVDETREELRALWARLLAAAMDPKRRDAVRLSTLEIARKLDPLDAIIIPLLNYAPGHYAPNHIDYFKATLKRSPDEVAVSFENLVALGCVRIGVDGPSWTATGRLLVYAVGD